MTPDHIVSQATAAYADTTLLVGQLLSGLDTDTLTDSARTATRLANLAPGIGRHMYLFLGATIVDLIGELERSQVGTADEWLARVCLDAADAIDGVEHAQQFTTGGDV